MSGTKGNSEFCFPEILNAPRGEAEGNIEVEPGPLSETMIGNWSTISFYPIVGFECS